ncbi:transglycosylase SLT domain-containing protein, partial [Megasphaera sp.]|uniref:transglycosylase SLT domain-containing protein n=1 Tax=Megasphaera sp. TaxID=2023260 RepID=UPI0040264810
MYSDIPGTPVASGQFGDIEDESVRDERMKESADYMAANWPRLYGTVVAADEGLANVVGGIQNAVGGGNGILTNVQRAEEGMQNYRDQWNNEYGDSYFLNPNKFATDVGSGIGSTVPIMALSALMPGAAVAGGTRALTSALSRAGLGRLAMSKAGQALIADTVRSPISSLADSLSEYGTVVNDMMQDGMSEDEARRRAIPMFFKNMALDTFTVPLELGVMKGGKGIATSLLGRSAGEGVAKSIAKGASRTGMLAGASGLTEGYQEGAQNALENDVEGNRDGGWYNPFTWTNEDWEAARGGFVGGALMGVPGNVAAGFHPEARQAPLSAESQEQAQSIKDTLSHGKPAGMSNAAYNAYIELANSGNPDLIKQAASSLESFQQSQEGSQESADDAATEAYKDYETYDQKQEIENFLDNNTVEQIGGEKNFNWLMGVLRNGTPEEVQRAYDTVIAAEKATAEQEAKNRPARSGGSMSPNTGNAMANIVIQAANDSGVEPRLGLAIAARESGGDDVNAISMPEPHDGIYGIMQAQEETVSELGLDSQYPDWKTDPYQNAMVGMAILKSKIANENGDVWAGVRDYNGAGEEAEQYRQLVKNNYDNMGDIGGSGNSWSAGVTGYNLPTQSDDIAAQVETLKPGWKQALPAIGGILNQMGLADGAAISSGGRTTAHNAEVGGAEHSYHINDDERGGGDAVDIVLPKGTTEEQAQAVLERFKETGAFKEVLFHDAGSGYHLHLGGYTGGLSSSGVSGKVAGDNGQFERELDQAAQEAKSDMDKIQAQSDQAMNEIMNDDSAEKTAQDAQQDAENAQKQAEESQQSAQDDVVPDVAQTIRDTSNNIDEINTLDGMFTKDSNGNDKFIDTPENRDFIKANYKDEITKAVNDAMSKKKAPSATPVPKAQQQTPHARLGRILSTYDRKDPQFTE